MTKSLLEQWNEDCQRLSKPHLQWEKQCVSGRDKWFICKGKKVVESAFSNNIPVRRIESLALPFDLEDAMNGGNVEFYLGVHNLPPIDVKFISQSGNKIIIEDQYGRHYVEPKYLRMKESRLKTTTGSD